MHPKCQERIADATAFVLRAHAQQTRKGTTIPYVSHLLQVSGAVLEYGGSTDQAIAALCHDTIEDCGVSRRELADQFGEAVAKMVADCTDTLDTDTPENKSDWKTRKVAYLAHLAQADADSVLVAACDKMHNLSCIVSDVRAVGTDYLDRFSGKPHQQLWYFSTFLKNTQDRLPQRLVLAFEAQLAQFQAQIGL
jgi:(p)ppGpp synthase/HD superfamily hydrolase